MAYRNVLTAGATTLYTGRIRRTMITVNSALTGTIIVTDGLVTVATITNPPVGGTLQYWDLQTNLTVNPSAACDITVNIDTSRGPH